MSEYGEIITKDTPLITVIMSVFNGCQWLSESIESVLKQTFTKFEFIIVDDGSTDNSVEIIQRYQSQDSRIHLISKDNSGLADSLNHAIQIARGQWIARLDADDICEPMRLEKQFEFSQHNPSIVFIGTGHSVINSQGQVEGTFSYPTNHEQLLGNLINIRKYPAHSSAFYKADTVRALGGYRPRIKRSQDCDLWLRLSEVGRLASLKEPLIRLRYHPEQISDIGGSKGQFFYSRMAMISYWLRIRGLTDPVDATESNYELFVKWLELQLKNNGLYEFHAHFAIFYTFLQKPSLRKFLAFAAHILPPQALRSIFFLVDQHLESICCFAY
jgi:glycosyltransferase involved in cell wall biosynthesis